MTTRDIRFLTRTSNVDRLAQHCLLDPRSLERQMRTAHRLLERLFFTPRRAGQGMLLADEVGLGKTTVGALVALVAARQGDKRSVRILAPNPTVAQRWRDELELLANGLAELNGLSFDTSRIKTDWQRLRAGRIHVTTRGRALKRNQVRGDLVIVDEAHRSKHAESEFRKAIVHASQLDSQLLFLTATPMSVRPSDMAGLLNVLGGERVAGAAQALGDAIVKLYDPNDERSEHEVCTHLEQAAQQALAIIPDYVVRHTIDHLARNEQAVFGRKPEQWAITVPAAGSEELALLARADRILRLAYPRGKRSNDPQYHVARTPLRNALAEARCILQNTARWDFAAPHFHAIDRAGLLDGVHPKMQALAKALRGPVASGDKTVVFCRHHLVAAELTRVLDKALPSHPHSDIDPAVWRDALQRIIPMPDEDAMTGTQRRWARTVRENFIHWMCTPSFRNQIASWLPRARITSVDRLVAALRKAKAQRSHRGQSIAAALTSLCEEVTNPHARSTWEIFRRLGQSRVRGEVKLESLPFGSPDATSRVLGACETGKDEPARHMFLQETRPELLMALFNSPFGPDVLILTDRYSEGIDLHKACRLLVHYELDPSAMRTVQRNGRVRRVGGLAGATRSPVAYAMPAFQGTRDERLVQIMRERLNNFGLLLGAVRDVDDADLDNDIDARAQRILAKSKKTLAALSKAMTCPG